MKVFILDWSVPEKDTGGDFYTTNRRMLFATKEAAEKYKDSLVAARQLIGMTEIVMYASVGEIEVHE